jgi:hypothetical protein
MKVRALVGFGIAALAMQTVFAAGMEDLAIYKSGGPSQGLWRMEIISSNDPNMSTAGGLASQMAICMDTAKQLSKDLQSSGEQSKCETKIIRNTAAVAEIDAVCPSGKSHTTVTRDGDKNFVMDMSTTNKEGKERNFKARYKYEGPCKGDALIQMDKNSEACKQMGNIDLSKMAGMCANMPVEQRAACEQRMKNFATMCK